mmetsp:Transcript_9313/g.22874  ORF Transcript_9313/g.22874 Transcript_9313/m.22874 type:complete len:214 (-) Transcript_9313:145-786(-)
MGGSIAHECHLGIVGCLQDFQGDFGRSQKGRQAIARFRRSWYPQVGIVVATKDPQVLARERAVAFLEQAFEGWIVRNVECSEVGYAHRDGFSRDFCAACDDLAHLVVGKVEFDQRGCAFGRAQEKSHIESVQSVSRQIEDRELLERSERQCVGNPHPAISKPKRPYRPIIQDPFVYERVSQPILVVGKIHYRHQLFCVVARAEGKFEDLLRKG